MYNYTIFAGLDVHKKNIVVAILERLEEQDKYTMLEVPNTQKGIKKLASSLKKLSKKLKKGILSCYESGFCGYGLQRLLQSHQIECKVIAPSLVPGKPGDHIKTDRKDAKKLALYLSTGLLTEVHPPTQEEESVRNLCRCFDQNKKDLTRYRHRMTKFLSRNTLRYEGGKNWTLAHRKWLKGIKFPERANQIVFDHYLFEIEQKEASIA